MVTPAKVFGEVSRVFAGIHVTVTQGVMEGKTFHAPGERLTNFTRLEVFGSLSLHGVKATVDPKSEHVFQVQPVMVQQP